MSYVLNKWASTLNASFYAEIGPEVIQGVWAVDSLLGVALRALMNRLAKVSPRYIGHVVVARERVEETTAATSLEMRVYMVDWNFEHVATPTVELIPEMEEESTRGLLVRFTLDLRKHRWAYFDHEFTEIVRQ